MKVALCLFGIVGGTDKNGAGKTVDFRACAKSYCDNIIGPNNADVFFHTWSDEHYQKLIQLYSPKMCYAEPQSLFGLDLSKERDRFLAYSRWTSHKKVLDMRSVYERDHGKYDLIMLGRFDTMWFHPVDFTQFDPSCFYASNWNSSPSWMGSAARHGDLVDRTNVSPKAHRLLDLWFVANSPFMDYFAQMPAVLEEIKTHKPYDPHAQSWVHLTNHKAIRRRIRYEFYRWIDYELWRYKHGSE